MTESEMSLVKEAVLNVLPNFHHTDLDQKACEAAAEMIAKYIVRKKIEEALGREMK